jgi:hypothetical protein
MLRWAADRGVRLHHIAPRQADPKRVLRKLQWPAARRMPQRVRLRFSGSRPRSSRRVARTLQA